MSRKTGGDSAVTILYPGEKHMIRDAKTGSKAWAPIQIDEGNRVEAVKVDRGLITGLSKGELICDDLVFTIEDSFAHINITWLIELKGSRNVKEAEHSINQIKKSIEYLQDHTRFPQAEKYLKNRDYVFAAVAGAPDKTLPVISNDKIKQLCRLLYKHSGKKQNVKDMFRLFFYIRPNPGCRDAYINGINPPYNIICYSNGNSYITYPSLLLKLLEQ